MEIKECIFTENRCYKAGKKIKPAGTMVHSTGANNPYLSRYVQPDDGLLGKNKYGNDWNREFSPGKCVHAIIGRDQYGNVRCYQTLPWDHRGWHAGSGKNGSANDTHISFEICEDSLNDPGYFEQVYNLAAQLCAYLCKEFDLETETVICHAEGHSLGIASDHADVMHWFSRFDVSMDDFREDVQMFIDLDKEENTMEEKKLDNTPATWEKDGVDWALKNKLMFGDEHGNLKLHDPITRATFCVMLQRYHNLREIII